MRHAHDYEVNGFQFFTSGRQEPDGTYRGIAHFVGRADTGKNYDPPVEIKMPNTTRYLEDALGEARNFVEALAVSGILKATLDALECPSHVASSAENKSG